MSPTKAKVLIVEDQPAVAEALATLFELRELPSVRASGPAEALAALAREPVGVVVQDMNFTPGATSGEEGAALFRELRRRHPGLPVVLLTAWTSLESAVELVKEGAGDYVGKPWDDDKLAATVADLLAVGERELEARRSGATGRRAHQALAGSDLCGAVWASAELDLLVATAVRVARSDAPVLITGPSGAGKEKLAEIVQANSPRRRRPFVRVNAAALPAELVEAELFGAEAGAFTGAVRRRLGRFEAADGGTLFLDEIGTLPLSGQVKLLRVLQRGEFERLGSSETRRVDVRILCATNADLETAIAEGRFRADLYYRLNVFELALPPLAERPEDVLPLARAFLQELSPAATGGLWKLTAGAEAALLAHPWPGNVRELRNALQRATVLAEGDTLEAADLGLAPPPGGAHEGPAAAAGSAEAAPDPERLRLERALARSGGVVARAAAELGLSRQALYRRMEKHGLAIERRLKR